MRKTAAIAAGAFFTLASFDPAAAATPDAFYAGKTLRIIVGLAPGGTVDTFARFFSAYLRKHIPGNPAILVQNMPGAGGKNATNYLAEKAEADGLTILYGPWDPLAQALRDKGLRARYENFEFIGGTGDIRVLYGRTDIIPGGVKKPADIGKAQNLALGALNNTDISGLLPHLALDVLGIRHKMIVGYRGGSDVFLAMQRGEVQIHSTSITSFRHRNAEFVKSGRGMGFAYFVPVDANGHYRARKFIREMPAFPDLYKQIHGSMPAGANWEALNWLTNQIGELTFVGIAPHGTPAPAVAALRAGYAAAAHDPGFIKDSVRRYKIPFTYIPPAEGRAVFGSLANVSSGVLATLQKATSAQK